MHQTQGLKLVFIKTWVTYNAPGLAFQERGGWWSRHSGRSSSLASPSATYASAPGLSATPSVALVHTRAMPILWEHLLHAHAYTCVFNKLVTW
jgi:hypothetical protein